MNRKIFGILIVALLITPIAIGSIEEQKEETEYIENLNSVNMAYWYLNILVKDLSTSNEFTIVLGEASGATDGYDSFDETKILMWDFDAWFSCDGYNLRKDTKEYPDTFKFWDLRIYSDHSATINLRWSSTVVTQIRDMMGEYTMFSIYNNEITKDMLTCSEFEFNIDPGRTESIIIFFNYNEPPDTPSTPSGPNTRTVHQSGTYSTIATDPDYHSLKYRFNWGDGHISQWTNFLNSGETGYLTHSWSNPGTYQVKAQAKDCWDFESSWSTSYAVTVNEEQVGEPPETPEILDAPTLMQYGETYDFTAVTTDPDDDDVQYGFTWDYADETWELLETEFMESGEPVTVQKSFESPGYTQFISMDVGAVDTNGLASEFCEPITIEISDPPEQVFITGQRSGTAGEEYTYEIRGYDPNPNDLVYFEIDWDDDQTTTTDEVPIMSAVNISHTWADQGDYVITATVYDSSSIEGPTTTLRVSMPKVKTHRWFHPWLSGLFERFPFFEPLLQQILGLQ